MKRVLWIAGIILIVLDCSYIFLHKHKSFVQPVQSVNVIPDKPEVVIPPTPEGLLKLINTERVNYGVKPLTIDDNVQQVAQIKANDMYENNYFSHIMPKYGKVASPQMYALLMASCTYSSENITKNVGVNDDKHAVNAWIHSAPHHEAMIDPKYTTTGFGIKGQDIVESFCVSK